MSMFSYSLKLDERLSPSEILVQDKFFSRSNTNRVTQMVREKVDSSYSQGRVVDTMHDVFTRALGGKTGVGSDINKINAEVVAQALQRKVSSDQASKISRRVGFERNKVPTTMLPRASFSLESEDEGRGKVSYTFM